MLQKFSLLAFLSILFLSANAQKKEVSGLVKDTATKASVKNAVVMLVSPKDSVIMAFTRVKDDGSYSFVNVVPGKYILEMI